MYISDRLACEVALRLIYAAFEVDPPIPEVSTAAEPPKVQWWGAEGNGINWLYGCAGCLQVHPAYPGEEIVGMGDCDVSVLSIGARYVSPVHENHWPSLLLDVALCNCLRGAFEDMDDEVIYDGGNPVEVRMGTALSVGHSMLWMVPAMRSASLLATRWGCNKDVWGAYRDSWLLYDKEGMLVFYGDMSLEERVGVLGVEVATCT